MVTAELFTVLLMYLDEEPERYREEHGSREVTQRRQVRDRRIVWIDFVLPHGVNNDMCDVQQ